MCYGYKRGVLQTPKKGGRTAVVWSCERVHNLMHHRAPFDAIFGGLALWAVWHGTVTIRLLQTAQFWPIRTRT